MKKKMLLVFTLIFAIGLMLTLAATTTKAQTSGTSITLYAGAVTSGSGTYGFGLSSSDITSPGPTLNLVKGTTYTVTVDNVGNIPHSWEISSTKAVATSPLFNAGIDTTTYISPGTSASVTFTPNQTGNFYYVCTVPGHISLGMYGSVVVASSSSSASPTTPEFPSALTFTLIALVAGALVATLAKQKTKIKAA